MADRQSLFELALQLHRSGRVKDAIPLYSRLLKKQKNNADVLYLLGTANIQIGQLGRAVQHLQRALSLDPRNVDGHVNLGNAYRRLGQPDNALDAYDRAIEVNPEQVEAYLNRGNVFRDLDRADEALAAFDKAIALRPDFAPAHNSRGAALRDLARLDEALAAYDRAIDLRHDYANAHYNRGNALMEGGRYEEALASYDTAIDLNPQLAAAHDNRGCVLETLGRFDEALTAFERAIELMPGNPEAHFNRAHLLANGQRLDEALASYDTAIYLQPDYVAAHCNRGGVLADQMRLEEALAAFEKAIELSPDFAEAYYNRGNTLRDLKRFEEALRSYDKALMLKPDDPEVHWNKSLVLLLTGRYREGWALYEWRLRREQSKSQYYSFAEPAWMGEGNIEGRKLLVYSEQGLGDTLQYCRYLPLVEARGAEIVFETAEPLIPLVSSLNCGMTVVAKGAELPAFDAYCPLMSLPRAFGTAVETIPADTPYLFSDGAKVEKWAKKLGPKDRLRVGLAWSGSATNSKDARRSVPLDKLLPIIALPVEWHSLQKEYRDSDREFLEQHPEIRQHQDDLEDFSDTAALVDCLDLVISVDTSVAHLAGALGKPVWLLLSFAAHYVWMADRTDSPWYPSATLFRQNAIGDWENVIAEVAAALRNRLHEPQEAVKRTALYGTGAQLSR